MQLLARDGHKTVLASDAKKGVSYRCPECNGVLRKRMGTHRAPHFFHLQKPKHCRQHQKSQTHLLLQHHLLSILPGASIENPYPEVGRIADVAWHATKVIFEIQCSAISLEEARGRNADYLSLGLTPVWILHDRRYNKRRLTVAERYLREGLCFFTNFSPTYGGIIYDQFDICRNLRRLFRSRPYPINLAQLSQSRLFAGSVAQRAQNDPLFAHWIQTRKAFFEKKDPKHSLWQQFAMTYRALVLALLQKFSG
jgi:competence protein CoiA